MKCGGSARLWRLQRSWCRSGGGLAGGGAARSSPTVSTLKTFHFLHTASNSPYSVSSVSNTRSGSCIEAQAVKPCGGRQAMVSERGCSERGGIRRKAA